ncbi:MAG TPA: hypothetical protein EYQ80_01900 [Candidatus Poseidoniales archaeon]|nr:hypothetical protein [Candidatus Poseidoniales archaeon]
MVEGRHGQGRDGVRLLIFAGEHPVHIQHVRTVLAACDAAGDEYVFYIGKDAPLPGTFAPRNPLLHRLRDFLWDRFGWTRNRFVPSRFKWTHKVTESDRYRCKAIKGDLPWKPDVVLVVTPHEGHARYQLIPWARKAGIPVLSIDHGMPTVAWPWSAYRGSMMGCTANAVWSEVCRDINIQLGSPPDLQVITGSPSIDGLAQDSDSIDSLDIADDKRVILLLGTHRPSVKAPTDALFREVIQTYGEDSDFQIVLKPHPVEMSQGTVIDVPDSVLLTTEQNTYLPLVQRADVVVSPPTSVVVPATAFKRAFVNTLSVDCGAAPEVDLQRVLDRLGAAIFTPDRLHEVIRGEVEVDAAACDAAFAQFGFKRDGRNGSRVLSLARHLAEGGVPEEWESP